MKTKKIIKPENAYIYFSWQISYSAPNKDVESISDAGSNKNVSSGLIFSGDLGRS